MSAAGTSVSLPSRTTRALGAVISFRRVNAASARLSCVYPMVALRTTMARITNASIQSLRMTPEMKAATRSTQMRTSANWLRNRRRRDGPSCGCRTFGPPSARRRLASSEDNPVAVSAPSLSPTSAALRACHGVSVFGVMTMTDSRRTGLR